MILIDTYILVSLVTMCQFDEYKHACLYKFGLNIVAHHLSDAQRLQDVLETTKAIGTCPGLVRAGEEGP